MQIEYTRTALKGLRKLPSNDAITIISKLEAYAETGAGDVKKLQGVAAYRLRYGNYRAIFQIEGNMLVVKIAHRKDIYQ